MRCFVWEISEKEGLGGDGVFFKWEGRGRFEALLVAQTGGCGWRGYEREEKEGEREVDNLSTCGCVIQLYLWENTRFIEIREFGWGFLMLSHNKYSTGFLFFAVWLGESLSYLWFLDVSVTKRGRRKRRGGGGRDRRGRRKGGGRRGGRRG